MKIKGDGLNIGNAIDTIKKGFNSNNSNGFDDLLSNMSTKGNKENSYKTDTNTNNDKNYKTKTNNLNNTTNPLDNKDINSEEKIFNKKENVKNNTTEKETNVKKEEETKSKEVEKEEKIPKEDKELEEEKAVENLSKILGVSNEALVKVMEELDLTIVDLEEGENLVNLLVEINGLSEQVELLNLENLTEQVSQIKELVNEVKGKVDLNVFENIEKIDATDDLEVSKLVENLQEMDKIFNENQGDLTDSESENQDSTNEEEPQVPMTSIRDINDVKPEMVAGQVTDFDDEFQIDETTLTNGSTINDITKTDSFVNQVSREISGRNVNTADVVKQLVEAMKVEVKADTTSEIKIMLRPQHLGDVTLKIATENGIIVAQFVADSERVKAIIEANFNTLRDNLLEQGVNVGQLEVTVRDNGNDSSNDTGYSNANTGNGHIDGVEGESIETTTSDADKKQVLGSTVDYSA